jgi:hypothetical protein
MVVALNGHISSPPELVHKVNIFLLMSVVFPQSKLKLHAVILIQSVNFIFMEVEVFRGKIITWYHATVS